MIDYLTVPLLVFFIVLLLIILLQQLLSQHAAVEKIKNRVLLITKKNTLQAEAKNLFQTQRRSLIEKKLQKYFKQLRTESWFKLKLYQAGIQTSVINILLIEILFFIVLVLINTYFRILHFYTGMFVCLILLVSVNVLILNVLIKRRRKKIMAQLPVALDIILRAIRAGHSLEKVLTVVAREIPPPLGDEMARMCHQLDLGVSFESALHDAAGRIGLRDFNFFAISLIIQRQSGGSLSEVLENIIYVLIRRQEIRLKTAALTAEARTTSYILAAIPIVIWIAVSALNPGYLDFFLRTTTGQKLLALCIGLLVIEFLIMRWMMRFKIY
jgi:tight adherence protein B